MSRPAVTDAVTEQLRACGHPASTVDRDLPLVRAGVNSATVIQVLSTLEDVFDVDLDLDRLFAEPLTPARIEAEIIRALDR